jgi:hypothetical protein
MKKFALLLALLPLFCVAQENVLSDNQPSFPKHELGFSFGAFPLIGVSYHPDVQSNAYFEGLLPRFFIGYHNNDVRDDLFEKSYLIGAFSLKYNYIVSSSHYFGATLTWSARHFYTNWIGIDKVPARTGWENYFVIQPNYKHSYCQHRNWSLYFSAHVGIIIYVQSRALMADHQSGNVWVLPAFHITPIGVMINLDEKHALDVNLGMGTQGVLQVGYSYKF